MPATRTTTDLDWNGTPVRLVRSTARTRTVSAVWRGGRLQISVPARLTRGEEQRWIARMVDRAGTSHPVDVGSPLAPPAADADGSAAPHADRSAVQGGTAPAARRAREDAALLARAERLAAEHLDGRAHAAPETPDLAVPSRFPRPVCVRWSSRQRHRWGSCTPAARTIRLSAQLRGMPTWVVDAVLVHELAHLVEGTHGERFQAIVARFPRYAEAMAFLQGVTYAQHRGLGAARPGTADDDVAAPAPGEGGWDGDVEGE